MTTHQNDRSDDDKLPPVDHSRSGDKPQRREPLFSGFGDDDEGFEEPDRDTDYSSGYGADSVEEDDFDDELTEEDDSGLFLDHETDAAREPENIWEDEEPTEDDDSQEWEEDESDEETNGAGWPLGLIAVALIALALLAVGGYGVIQQRSATQEEIRELRAALATAASPGDVNASRTALQDMKDANAELVAAADALTMENRRLTDTVAGLEAQLEAQQAALNPATENVKNEAPPPTPKVAPAPKTETPKPATPEPAAPAANTTAAAAEAGTWFVNFGSYAQPEMAETWASRLRPSAGKVITAPSTKDGRTFYRVRVVNLANKTAATKVARNLEAELGVSSLWVGSE